jgi:hypothetical protein
VTGIGDLGATLAATSDRRTVTANVVPSSSIPVTLMTEALSYSERPVLKRATRRHVPEDGMLHIHRRENLKSYNVVFTFSTNNTAITEYNRFYKSL